MSFLLACGSAAAVNFGSRMILGIWFSYVVSIILAYLLGIITAYLLCRCFVFQAKHNNTWQQIGYFCLINGFAIVLTVVVSLLLFHYALWFVQDLFLREEIAHFIGIAAPAISSYFGHKYFSFK